MTASEINCLMICDSVVFNCEACPTLTSVLIAVMSMSSSPLARISKASIIASSSSSDNLGEVLARGLIVEDPIFMMLDPEEPDDKP